MANTVNDALQHLDALLSVEADALTDDELLLVTDMVQQLVGGTGAGSAQQQQLMSTPAGSNLAAQIEQMLPGVMQMAQQQSQQQQHHALSTATSTAQNLQYQQAQQAQSPAGFCSYLSLNSQPNLHSSVRATDASGLASPSDSSISGRSSPVSPRSRPLIPRPLMQPQHQAPAPAAAVPAVPAQPDAAVQAAADVLTAALTNPNASIDEIAGIFDQVLTAGERNAKELQQRLTTPQPQQPAPAAQSPQAQQYSMQSYQQRQEPGFPVLAAGSKQSALNAYLQEQHGSPEQPVLSPGSPPARSITSQWPSSRLSQQAAAAADWQQDRPNTSPAHVSSQYIAQQGGSVSLRTSSHSTTSTSPSAAMMAAAAARRSQSPDVFRRLSVMSTASATARQSAVQAPPRNSNSPVDIERNWLGTLRDSKNDRSSPPIRSRSNSRSRDSSPTVLQQQQGAQEVPWLTAASVQSARNSMSPGPMEWDADSRSIKAGSGGSWVNPNSKRRGPGQDSEDGDKAPEVPQKQPVKLPAHVIEERMRRFYARNVDWKNRCAQVYKRQREQQQEGEVEECTFAPVINKKSERMAQELRTSYPMRPVRPITPLANAAEEVEQQLRKQQLLQQQRRSASTGKMRQKQQPQGWLYSAGGSAVPGFGCSSTSGADQAMPPAAKRLFQDAVVRMQRAEQTKEMTAEAERKARSWSAPRRPAAEGVPPRVYDHLDPVRSSSKQRGQKHAGSDECMFKPWTNPRRKPTSAPFTTAATSAAMAGVRVERETSEEVLEEFVAMLDDAAELQQQQQPSRQQQQMWPGTASAGGRQQQQPRSPSANRRIGSATKNEDLDWDEFIERQSRFIRSKQAKVAAVAEREYCSPSPELSPGTKRILRGKQALADNAGSPSHTQAYSGSPQSPHKQGQRDFLGRLQQESDCQTSTGASSSPGYGTAESPVARRAAKTSGGGGSSGKGSSGGWTSDEYTYKPRITSKAAAKKGRSFEEMSEGDRLRREVRLEQMRVLKEAKELAAATFRPDLSPSRQRAGESFAAVPPKLSLTSEGLAAYMASLQEKRRQLEERRMKAQSRKQEEELRECTFKPETTPVPAYITEMAEVGYTARYIDRVMQGALTDGRLGSTVAAVAKALKPTDGGVKEAPRPATAAASSPQKPQLITTKY